MQYLESNDILYSAGGWNALNGFCIIIWKCIWFIVADFSIPAIKKAMIPDVTIFLLTFIDIDLERYL